MLIYLSTVKNLRYFYFTGVFPFLETPMEILQFVIPQHVAHVRILQIHIYYLRHRGYEMGRLSRVHGVHFTADTCLL